MKITHRPYAGIRDFIVMTSILAIGRKTDTHAHYIHIGDLSWWMFYTDHPDSHWQDHICLWEDDGDIIGWTLLDPHWCSFDVYLLPRLRASVEEAYILEELEYCEKAYRSIPGIATIDVTNRSIEEISEWITHHVL